MTDIVERLRAAQFDKDNFPRMKSERNLSVGLALEAADEIERLKVMSCAHYLRRLARLESALAMEHKARTP